MFNFVSVKVKCPRCGTSLMDQEHPVDNEPSIKLNIKIDDEEGTIYLSSIYGSYNYTCDLEVEEGKVARFFCPDCEDELTSDVECEECGAPMIPLYLIEGGKITFCSRAGCKKHTAEFEDLSSALQHIYKDYSYFSSRAEEFVELPEKKEHKRKKTEEEIKKEIMKTGTYLRSFCPHCKKSLIENNMLKFKIEKQDGESGFLMLSPYLNVFTHKSTIRLPEKTALKDIKCPNCDTSLMEDEKKCNKCESDIARISVAAMSKMVDFYICSKKGCTWHGLSDEDLEDIMLEDSEEW